jgi:hypothetical protein
MYKLSLLSPYQTIIKKTELGTKLNQILFQRYYTAIRSLNLFRVYLINSLEATPSIVVGTQLTGSTICFASLRAATLALLLTMSRFQASAE